MESSVREVVSFLSSDGVKLVELQDAQQFLTLFEVSLDDNGFLVSEGEYIQPNVFSRERFECEEDVFDYFKPAPDREKVHLSDLYSIYKKDSPVAILDEPRSCLSFQNMTGLVPEYVCAWSTTLSVGHQRPKDNLSNAGLGGPSPTLRCNLPECDFSGPVGEWEGRSNDPICPECTLRWGDGYMACINCSEALVDKELDASICEGVPSCPHCGSEIEYVSRLRT